MRSLLILLSSFSLSASAYAHPSLIPHLETENAVLHTVLFTGVLIVAATVLYLVICKVLAPKRLSFKRHRN